MFEQIIRFWFEETTPDKWWQKDDYFDAEIKRRFINLHNQAKVGELFTWRDSAEGSLAEIIILDQFSRNIYRDTPEAFGCDSLALVLAQTAIAKRFDEKLPEVQRSFIYLPFMHSESQLIHEQAVKLYTALGNENNLDFELQHKRIIDRFGRYPHRNEILGRKSTPEEVQFLTEPNSSF